MQIVKICKKHGELTIDLIKKNISEKGTLLLKCKSCAIESQRKYAEKNPDKIKQHAIKYRKKYATQRLAECNEWRKKNREAYLASAREYQKKRVAELDDSYIVSELKSQLELSDELITPEIIEIKRSIIKINRIKRERK